MSAALEQMGIKFSRSTCGRLLSVNRDLYHLQVPRQGGRPKAAMPFRAERRHQFWSVDIRYLDMHRLPGVEVEWFLIIRMNPPIHRRRKKGHILLIQSPLWMMDNEEITKPSFKG